ncbi:MAG: hypothetical protein WDW36_004334 [Sanguina aurantia]
MPSDERTLVAAATAATAAAAEAWSSPNAALTAQDGGINFRGESRLLSGDAGCAQIPTPPALDRHCPFSTLHLLTCLYKASGKKDAVRCAIVLYGAAAAQGQWGRSTNIEEQSNLLSENSPDILTIYDLQGTILHQNNASMAYLGNHTTFISSSALVLDKRDLLCALFHLSPEKYAEMMMDLHSKILDGDSAVQEVLAAQTPMRVSPVSRPLCGPQGFGGDGRVSHRPHASVNSRRSVELISALQAVPRTRTNFDRANHAHVVTTNAAGYLGTAGKVILPSAAESARARRAPPKAAAALRTPETQPGEGTGWQAPPPPRWRPWASGWREPSAPPYDSKQGAPGHQTVSLDCSRNQHRSPPSGPRQRLPRDASLDSLSRLGLGHSNQPFAKRSLLYSLSSREDKGPLADPPRGTSHSFSEAGHDRSPSATLVSPSLGIPPRGSRLLNGRLSSNQVPQCSPSNQGPLLATVPLNPTGEGVSEGRAHDDVERTLWASEFESVVDGKAAGTAPALPRQEPDGSDLQDDPHPSGCSAASSQDHSVLDVYHRVTATYVRDVVLGETRIVLTQVDVTEKVHRERELQKLVFAEEKLLESVFPRHVIEELTQRVISLKPNRVDKHMATSHDQVTILFADLVGFTTISEQLLPEQVMLLLNRLYTAFDDLLDKFGVYKVETIGDCYVVAGGLMQKDKDDFQAVRKKTSGVCPDNASSTMRFAKAMLDEAAKVMHPLTHQPLHMRIGMHTGPVMSGVVGTRMPRFCLFGDTINTASRMESMSSPGCIHVSAATYSLLRHDDQWSGSGGVQVKGKGLMETYFWVPPITAGK